MHSVHQPEGVMPDSLAPVYAVTAQITGIFLITPEQVAAAPVGILLTAHSMIIAAYLFHERAHVPLFRARVLRRWVGEPMAWIAGAPAAKGEKIVAAICSRMAEALQKEFFV